MGAIKAIKTDEFILTSLRKCALDLASALEGEILFLKSSIYMGLDDAVRVETEKIVREQGEKVKEKLIVILETNGGYIETVERICNVFRRHFTEVVFIIPNYAYSAGTVLALSGDEIYMDYYSVLGPIDPQVQDSSGKFVPGMGYLYEFNKLIEKSRNGNMTEAELMFLVRRFDPAEMFVIEQAKNHSEELIRKWLVEYKFKNWDFTETRKKKVTPKMKKERAKQIAEILGDVAKWHSHGRGITLKELRSQRINLRINDYGQFADISLLIRQYYDLLTDYCAKMRFGNILHSINGLSDL